MQKPPAKKHSWFVRTFTPHSVYGDERRKKLWRHLAKRWGILLLLIVLNIFFLYFSRFLAAICGFVTAMGFCIFAIHCIRIGVALERSGTLSEKKESPFFFWCWIGIYFIFAAFYFMEFILLLIPMPQNPA